MKIYNHLDGNDMLPEEQKDCRKGIRGTKDQLLIDRTVVKNYKQWKCRLPMGWIDYKKAFDMISYSWFLKCLNIFKVADNINGLVKQSMLNWETELTSANNKLGIIKIKREIFQGDSLSPLSFIITLKLLSLVLRKVKAGKQFSRSPVINHLFVDDLKLFGKTESRLYTLLNTVHICSQYIKMEFGIC